MGTFLLATTGRAVVTRFRWSEGFLTRAVVSRAVLPPSLTPCFVHRLATEKKFQCFFRSEGSNSKDDNNHEFFLVWWSEDFFLGERHCVPIAEDVGGLRGVVCEV